MGPSVFDRILAVNLFGTLAVVLIALLGFLIDRPEFLDISLVYALINFIGTIAVTKYCVLANFNAPVEEQDWDDI
jgi:multicomponent Na+:H+ antiporter subunit F